MRSRGRGAAAAAAVLRQAALIKWKRSCYLDKNGGDTQGRSWARGSNEFFHLGGEGVCVFQGDVHSLRKPLIRKCQPCACRIITFSDGKNDATFPFRPLSGQLERRCNLVIAERGRKWPPGVRRHKRLHAALTTSDPVTPSGSICAWARQVHGEEGKKKSCENDAKCDDPKPKKTANN